MLVSIITPCFNSENFIQATYESIKNQTYSNWEWIVVDDHSTDNSVKVLQKIADVDDRVILLNNIGKSGAGPSRNVGISRAQGSMMTFIDSDDIWLPTFLEKSIHVMEVENVGFTFASYERWNEDFTIKYDDFCVPNVVDYKKLLFTCPISCLTACINIEKYGKIYMPDVYKRQDYALWLEYLKIIPIAKGIKEPLAKYRIRGNSLSSNKKSVVKYQFYIYYKHQKLGLIKSIFYLFSWAYHGFMKYRKIN